MPMRYTVTLSSVGNPTYAQDPDRPLPGVANMRKPVVNFIEASRVCRKYIDDNDLSSRNWSGGDVHDRSGALVAKVSYNGKVWTPEGANTLNAKPLYDPYATQDRPADPFAFDSHVVDVPEFGQISVTGCYGIGTIASVPGAFSFGGRTVEFIHGVTHLAEGGIEMHPDLILHPAGNMSISITAPKEMLNSLAQALKEWAASLEGRVLVMSNEKKDKLRTREYLTRNAAHHGAEMQRFISLSTENDVAIEDLDDAIEQLQAEQAPKP
ncbi:hypothetical protein [Bosea sp. RAC05]|uniref:hypothetical protein n=1 Tax=Bosea sp. RAC05 TaxID=1842539 RepID=UPI00085657A8|nr:hypothetical protein [Bosea sp. RAC05]AOG03400.1 hypothetical protein BSY19_4810 [Bosea sp. RAC05]